MTTMTAERPTTRRVAPRAQVAAVREAHAAQITAENYAEFVVSYATEVCSRCGGTGHMPYSVYGGQCFKCVRAGRVRTRAARKAYEALEAKRDEVYGTTWSEIKVGDVVWWSDSRTWRAVLTIEALPSGSLKVNGEDIACIKVSRARSNTTYHQRLDGAVRKHNVEGAVAVMRLAATLDGVQVTRKAVAQ